MPPVFLAVSARSVFPQNATDCDASSCQRVLTQLLRCWHNILSTQRTQARSVITGIVRMTARLCLNHRTAGIRIIGKVYHAETAVLSCQPRCTASILHSANASHSLGPTDHVQLLRPSRQQHGLTLKSERRLTQQREVTVSGLGTASVRLPR